MKLGRSAISVFAGLLSCLASNSARGQSNTFPDSGNVGVGTTTPAGQFQVQTPGYDVLTSSTSLDIGLGGTPTEWARSLRVLDTSGSNGQDGGAFGVVGLGTTPYYAYMAIPTGDPTGYESTKILVLNNSGYVGIGTKNPTGRLQVQTDAYDVLTSSTSLDIGLGGTPTEWARSLRVLDTSGSNGQDGGAFGVLGQGTTPYYAYMAIPTGDPTGFDSTKILVLNNAGQVGIGTKMPCAVNAPTDCILSANGAIQAKEVVVNTGWSDYVFEPGYRLAPLTEVADYIQAKHHLPGIPSAKEVEDQGVSVGKMQAELLAKIEELTLHMIEAEKENQELRERVKRLEHAHGDE